MGSTLVCEEARSWNLNICRLLPSTSECQLHLYPILRIELRYVDPVGTLTFFPSTFKTFSGKYSRAETNLSTTLVWDMK